MGEKGPSFLALHFTLLWNKADFSLRPGPCTRLAKSREIPLLVPLMQGFDPF